jgi:macrolide transport system ATP-binding/permease protein
LELQGYTETAGQNFYRQLLERESALAGVESASLCHQLPLGAGDSRIGINIEGNNSDTGESTEVSLSYVAPEYFETLRIPILRGRAFGHENRVGAPGVAVINETFARRYWPGQDAIGKHISIGSNQGGAQTRSLEVIGVVKDGKYVTLGEKPAPFLYLNLLQHYQPSLTLIVRTRGNPVDFLSAVRNEVVAMDKTMPLYDVKTMRQHLRLSLLTTQLTASALSVFGVVALILAATGIYGVLAYSVEQRTHEIGIRMALGANNGAVLKLVVKQGMILTLLGMALGLVASWTLTRLIKTLLFGVSATDPLTFIVIVFVLTTAGLLACYIPARRASKIDPMIALRHL